MKEIIIMSKATIVPEQDLLTEKERWQLALDEVRAAGARFRMNVRKCCRSCIEPKNLGLKDYDDPTPYGYTYGSQGFGTFWDDRENLKQLAETMYGQAKRPDRIYINHGNGSGALIAEAFKNQGFRVEWNGESFETVTIVLPAVI